MIQIRPGVFETNSSSTHSLVMCTGEEYDLLTKGELLIPSYGSKVFTLEQVRDDLRKWNPDTDLDALSTEELIELSDGEFCTLEQYFYDSYLETFKEEYITPSGERVVAFGRYGYDG